MMDDQALDKLTGTIAVTGGLVAGCSAPENDAVTVYRGLPYAAPPISDLRWRPPQPVVPWSGTRAATSFPPAAQQPPGGVISMFGSRPNAPVGEDCLYLNVWTSAERADAKLPVMVWIHGGGFRVGSGDNPMYNGVNLAAKGVVVVTFNYRLNVFGFLAHPGLSAESAHGASGNYGLMDQIAALRWVRENIAGFGGDPDNVTIFGESAGSRSVALLVAAPQARGLFHRGICQSGALRDVSDSLAEREALGAEIAATLGCDDIASLRAKPWEELHGAVPFNSNPFIDGWVIPEDPREIYAKGDIARVPLIIGVNKDEATMFDRPMKDRFDSSAKFQALVERTLGERAGGIFQAYVAQSNSYDATMALRTDQRMTLPARSQARWLCDAGVPVHLYFFTRVPPWKAGETLGAHHGAEIAYIFGGGIKCGQFNAQPDYSEVDGVLSHALMTYWTNFAASGDPNGDGLPHWPAFERDTEPFMELGDTIRAGSRLRGDFLDLLEGLPTVVI